MYVHDTQVYDTAQFSTTQHLIYWHAVVFKCNRSSADGIYWQEVGRPLASTRSGRKLVVIFATSVTIGPATELLISNDIPEHPRISDVILTGKPLASTRSGRKLVVIFATTVTIGPTDKLEA